MTPYPTRFRIRRIAAIIGFLTLLVAVGHPWAATPDVRILIDVSGSMKQNDPENLRVPALRLVTELLPEGAQSGVWLFAEDTEVLSAPGKVGDRWKGKTRGQLDRIHSRGLLTDIERAIKAASQGWEAPDQASDRHLVLLTDGLVDVSKDAEQSAASRARLLSTELPRLKELGVKVHAVALSDKVDAELMRTLSRETGGWFESARDADALQRVFLHMLEQAAAPTTVPLQGNRFEIDDQVSEFTLLAFHGPTGTTGLIDPAGKKFSAKEHPQAILWREEAGYDLVTISQPSPGTWQLEGVEDPDNRVVVVTDLGIEVAPQPNRLLPNTALQVETWLTDHQQPLTRMDLLTLLSAKAVLTNSAQPPQTQDHPLTLDQADARFRGTLNGESLSPGVYQLQILIDGGTFQRQLTRQIRVADPPMRVVYAREIPVDAAGSVALKGVLDIDRELIDPASLFGYVRMEGPEGRLAMAEISALGATPLTLQLPVTAPGDYRVVTRIMARTTTGEIIRHEPPPESFTFETVGAAAVEPPAESSHAEWSWVDLALYLTGGNLLILLMLGPTWWLMRRSGRGTPQKAKQS